MDYIWYRPLSRPPDVVRAWRERILERDGHACAACGNTSRPLHAAHLTPVLRFRWCYDGPGVEASYRWDNLVTLCNVCHHEQHERVYSWHSPRARRVYRIFGAMVNARGWRRVRDVPPYDSDERFTTSAGMAEILAERATLVCA
jgi:hypothetical protein